MKLSNIRVYLTNGRELFYAVGGRLLDKEGKEMVPSVVVEKITFMPFFKETNVYFSNGHILVYRGLDVSYEYGEEKIRSIVRAVKQFFMGNEGDTPPGSTGDV